MKKGEKLKAECVAGGRSDMAPKLRLLLHSYHEIDPEPK